MMISTSVTIVSNSFSKQCVGDEPFGYLSGCRSWGCHGHVLIKNKGGTTKGGANSKDSGWFGWYKQVQNQ
jgi:hypothetical protein